MSPQFNSFRFYKIINGTVIILANVIQVVQKNKWKYKVLNKFVLNDINNVLFTRPYLPSTAISYAKGNSLPNLISTKGIVRR